ncbi:MAG: FAD binding domain-containing protein [Anaerolineaceae bacterium]
MAVKEYIHVENVNDAIDLISDTTKINQFIAGGVGIAAQRKDGFLDCDQLIDISRISELQSEEKVSFEGKSYLKLGSVLSLTQISQSEYVQNDFPFFARVLVESSDPARRNAYTLGGRLATKIPVGMLLPALCALDAVVDVLKNGISNKISVVDWLSSEIFEEPYLITAVLIPYQSKINYSILDVKRRNYPGEIVAGVLVTTRETSSKLIENIKIFGSVDKYGLVSFSNISEFLNGKNISSELVRQAVELADQQITNKWGNDEDAQYRKRVLTALVSRCLNQVLL